MKKLVPRLGIAVIVLLAFWILLRLTGTLDYYAVGTGANLPNLKAGTHFFASKWKKPERLDFVCFNCEDPYTHKKVICTFRMCAVAGDVIEIKDGVLFVNDQNIDSNIQLLREFIVNKQYLPLFQKEDEDMYMVEVGADSMHVSATQKFINDNKIIAKQFIHAKDDVDEELSKQWGKSCNTDHFGPVTVPANSFFVLGDNRHNALDSRYMGFISFSNYRSTVIK